MTLTELQDAVEELLPGSSIGSDNDGQLVVYTDLSIDDDDPSGDLIDYEPPEDEDYDDDFISDEDIDRLEDELTESD